MPTRDRRFVRIVLIALVLSACEARPTKSDVTLFVVGSLRADSLGVHGFQVDVSPALDALARQSVVFDNAISPAPSKARREEERLARELDAHITTLRAGPVLRAKLVVHDESTRARLEALGYVE